MKRFPYSLFCILLAAGLGGCGHIGYYGQAISGHLEVMQRSQPIDTWLADSDTGPELRQRLRQARAIRSYASSDLHLPANDSYRQYADLGRPYVVWNVIVTPALSLQPRQWCFPFAGCVDYRGYYDKADALAFARRLDHAESDVYVAGATAYSTLGWFDDPLLNTMLYRDASRLAEVIFHELAHQQVYIQDDTAFNEAFAETVAIAGTRRWLERHAEADALAAYETRLQREARLLDMLFAGRRELRAIYTSQASAADKRHRKEAVLAELTQRSWQLRNGDWRDFSSFDAFFTGGLNNAKLAALATYRHLVPDFMRLLDSLDHDFQRFYHQVAALADCPAEDRRRWLEDRTTARDCADN